MKPDPKSVDCPNCGQPAGAPCKDLRGLYQPHGWVRSIKGFHRARKDRAKRERNRP